MLSKVYKLVVTVFPLVLFLTGLWLERTPSLLFQCGLSRERESINMFDLPSLVVVIGLHAHSFNDWKTKCWALKYFVHMPSFVLFFILMLAFKTEM